MADMKQLASMVYSIADNKDELIAVASCLLRSPDNYALGGFDVFVDSDKLNEIQTGKFATQDNETLFKLSLSVVSALMRGTLPLKNCDLVVLKSNVKSMKEEGRLDNLKRKGSAGKFALYTIEDTVPIEEPEEVDDGNTSGM